jgi:N-acyl-D-aspartate/D-glutamate deacylase
VHDVRQYLAAIDARGAGTNVIHLIPLGPVRSAIMGNVQRAPTESELERMKRLIDRGMEDGAWGISSGLIYVPGRYADTAELIELCKVVHRHGGLYATHIRNEGARLLESIDEAITIGKRAGVPLHISHLKASGKAYWGSVGPALARIKTAREAGQFVSADQYPYRTVNGVRSGNRFLRGAAGFPPRSKPFTGLERPTDLNSSKTDYRI